LSEVNNANAWSLITAILKVATGQLAVLLKEAENIGRQSTAISFIGMFVNYFHSHTGGIVKHRKMIYGSRICVLAPHTRKTAC
jgi:hypothetical protein